MRTVLALVLLAACGGPRPSSEAPAAPLSRCPAPPPLDLTGGCTVEGQGAIYAVDGTPLAGPVIPIGDVIGEPSPGVFTIGHCGGSSFRIPEDLAPLVDTGTMAHPDGVFATDAGPAFAPDGVPAEEFDIVRGADQARVFVPAPLEVNLPLDGAAAVQDGTPHPMLLVQDGAVTALFCVHTIADVEEVAEVEGDTVTVYAASTGDVIDTHPLGDDLMAWLATL